MKNPATRMAEFIIGLGLASALWVGWLAYDRWDKARYPVENIFAASVAVPDFTIGTDPLVIYDREIKKSFIGGFTVEIKNLQQVSVCYGITSGLKYDKGEQLDPTVTTLSWYVYAECAKHLKVGQYYIETTYTIDAADLPRKYLTTTSNIFTVGEPK